jgi:hypothetical protein
MTEIDEATAPFTEVEIKKHQAAHAPNGRCWSRHLRYVDVARTASVMSALPLRVQFLIELFDSLLPSRPLIWCKR